MAQYREAREAYAAPLPPNRAAQCKSRARQELASRDALLCEYEAAEVLGHYGVSFSRSRLVASAGEAVQTAAEFGATVALKVQSPQLPHKTEAGALVLSLRDPHAIEQAHATVIANARRHRLDVEIRGVLVQAMAPPGLELIVGVRRDPVFGPLLMVGLGGTLVEVLRDVAWSALPLDASQARQLLTRLRGQALLEGVRGSAPYDSEALIDLMVRVGEFAIDFADEIAEIDLNPVIVHTRGAGLSVVDAWMIRG
jgi:acyl-CoA synthetase (NDP forming)